MRPAAGFLDAYAREHGVRVGVHHAVTRAVARCLTELPALNVKVLGHALYALDSVNIAMPVHLEAADGRADETGMTIVRDVQRLSLKAVAACSRARAAEERTGRVTLSGSAAARRLARFVPDGLLRPALDGVRAALNHPLGYGLVESQFGVSSAVTNVGAVFNLPRGARFRAASARTPRGLRPGGDGVRRGAHRDGRGGRGRRGGHPHGAPARDDGGPPRGGRGADGPRRVARVRGPARARDPGVGAHSYTPSSCHPPRARSKPTR